MAECKECIHYDVCMKNAYINQTAMSECSDYTPIADVVEVKHGTWDNNGEFYQCSVCANFTGCDYDYCPYCGAKMDGGSDT